MASVTPAGRARRWTAVFAAAALFITVTQSGCSLFVMAGKMFYGDPKMTCAFTERTGVDLTDTDATVLVVVSAPEIVQSDLPSIRMDVIDALTRRLKRRGIQLIDPNKVATWIDDHGGTWNSPNELAARFSPDYIIHIDLDRFDYREENSVDLYRGTASGSVFVFEVQQQKEGEQVRTEEIIIREFNSVYPKGYPVAGDQVSAKSFQKRYISRVADQLAQLFYNYRASELVE